jgi:3-oxoadipate enol-lactonase
MPRVRANGIDVFYEVQGAGEPLLLIAGFASDHMIWSKAVAGLARHYRVLVFDNRGVGQTSGAHTVLSIRQMAEDAAGLLDAVELNPAHVAGHSMGGLIAQELALAHPEQVRTLTLLSSCAQLDERGKAIIESWWEAKTFCFPSHWRSNSRGASVAPSWSFWSRRDTDCSSSRPAQWPRPCSIF